MAAGFPGRPGPVQNKVIPETREIIQIYEKARDDIMLRVQAGLAGDLSVNRVRQAKLAEIQNIIAVATDDASVWAASVVPNAYKAGVISTRASLIEQGEEVDLGAKFGQIHVAQANLLASNLVTKFEDLEAFVGRKVNDVFRSAGLNAIVQKELGVLDRNQTVKKEIIQTLTDNKKKFFVDISGRRWSIDAYAEMVSRTTLREAVTTSQAIETLDQGFDLIEIIGVSAFDDSPCRPFEGVTLSLTGSTPGYTTLDEAISQGLYHPNCLEGWCEVQTSEGAMTIKEIRNGVVAFALSGLSQKIVFDVEFDYSGPIYSVVGANFEMAGTPDHACLSEFGWLVFSEIAVGNKMIQNINDIPAVKCDGFSPDVNNSESLIHKKAVADRFADNAFFVEMSSFVDLNDEISNDEIGDVSPDSDLKDKIKPSFFHPFGDERFMLVGIALESFREAISAFYSDLVPMGVSMIFDEMINRFPQHNSVLFQKLMSGGGGFRADKISNLSATHAFFIVDPVQKFADVANIFIKILSREYSHASGISVEIKNIKVYDIQTESGTYIMNNGIICHNCVHDQVAVVSEASRIDPSTLTPEKIRRAIPAR